MLASPLSPSFLDTYNPWISSLGCEALCIVTSFFLSSGPFVEVLWSTLRTVLSMLCEGQSRYLSVWWNFCYIVWFRVVFRSPEVFYLIFFFHLRMFDDVRFHNSQVFVSFFSFGSSIPSVICRFPLFIIRLHIDCIFSQLVLGFSIFFLQTIWCRPCTIVDWFFCCN